MSDHKHDGPACAECGDTHGPMFMHSRCHVEAPAWLVRHEDGRWELICSECRATIIPDVWIFIQNDMRTNATARAEQKNLDWVNHLEVFCDNCDWSGPYIEAVPAKHLSQRIDLNGPFTDVECPKCGALAYAQQ